MSDLSDFDLTPDQAEKVSVLDARMKTAEEQFAVLCNKPGRTRRQRERDFNHYVETIAQIAWERISVKTTPSMSYDELKSMLTAHAEEQRAVARQRMAATVQ